VDHAKANLFLQTALGEGPGSARRGTEFHQQSDARSGARQRGHRQGGSRRWRKANRALAANEIERRRRDRGEDQGLLLAYTQIRGALSMGPWVARRFVKPGRFWSRPPRPTRDDAVRRITFSRCTRIDTIRVFCDVPEKRRTSPSRRRSGHRQGRPASTASRSSAR